MRRRRCDFLVAVIVLDTLLLQPLGDRAEMLVRVGHNDLEGGLKMAARYIIYSCLRFSTQLKRIGQLSTLESSPELL